MLLQVEEVAREYYHRGRSVCIILGRNRSLRVISRSLCVLSAGCYVKRVWLLPLFVNIVAKIHWMLGYGLLADVMDYLGTGQSGV